MTAFSHINNLNIGQGSTINVVSGNQTFTYDPTDRCPSSSSPNILPRLTPMFTGREAILKQMTECFNKSETSVSIRKQRIFVLYGLGGSGKTQIMLKFIDQCGDRFTDIFYIDASSPATIQSGLENIARNANVGEMADDALRWLSRERKDWLLLFDNAVDRNLNIRRFFPSCHHGNIIVTTRNKECRLQAPESNCCISGMEPRDATELLLKKAMVRRSDKNRRLCADIAQELGYLALALSQAGAYIAQSSCLDDYLRIYKEDRVELLRRPSVQIMDDYESTVYTTWETSSKKLTPTAAVFLRICSFMHHEGISRRIFKLAATSEDRDHSLQHAALFLLNFKSDDGRWSDVRFFDIINELASYSLINVSTEGDMYWIHPLVHAWARDRASTAEKAEARICAIQILALSITTDYSVEGIAFRRTLLPHIDQARVGIQGSDIAARLHGTYMEAGRWKEAEELQKLVVARLKREFGDDHLNTLIIRSKLAQTYTRQGRWREAEVLQVGVMETLTRLLGAEHTATLSAMHSLGWTYSESGRWKSAEALMKTVAEARTKLLGDKHPATLAVTSNLAWTYSQQGHWKEAEALLIQVMDTTIDLFGDKHPYTLNVKTNLAWTYCKRYRWVDAEALITMILEARREILGDEHPDFLIDMSNLAWTYSEAGRQKEAEALMVKVMEVRIQLLGNEHPSTIDVMSNLSCNYSKQCRWTEAETLMKKVLEAQRKIFFGDECPATLTTRSNLAWSYCQQGRLKEAETLLMEVLEAGRSVLDNEHPLTLEIQSQLVAVYQEQGRWKETEAIQVEILRARRQRFGDEDPDTLLSMNSLGWTYSHQGEWDKAEELHLMALEKMKKHYGDEHLHTLGIKRCLGWLYSQRGRRDEAEALQLHVMQANKRIFSDEHPDTLIVMSDLANTYSCRGLWQEAEDLEARVVEVARVLVGDFHPRTKVSIAFLAGYYESRKRKQETSQI